MKKLIKIFIALVCKIKYWGKCKIHIFSNTVYGKCSFEGKNILGSGTYFVNSSMKYGSYIGRNCEFANCKLGRFCSVGSNVRVISATHPVNLLSTHPAFYSSSYYFSYHQIANAIEHLTTDDGFEAVIGNDVWIGDNVLIKGGLTIGDGAVIAMGSVVTHSVPPYTIVAGVPAKPIRKRFDEETIQALLEMRWWDKSIAWIEKYADTFVDPKKFVYDYIKERDENDNGK